MQTLAISLILLLIVVVGYLFYLLDKVKVKENTNKKTIKELRTTIYERDVTINHIKNRYDLVVNEKEELGKMLKQSDTNFQGYVDKVRKAITTVPNDSFMRVKRVNNDLYFFNLFNKEVSHTLNIEVKHITEPYATNN